MWMRKTVTALDMVFITPDGRIHRIAERTVPYSLATIESRGPVRATLELAAGTAERLGLRVGDRVEQRIFGSAKGPDGLLAAIPPASHCPRGSAPIVCHPTGRGAV